MTRMMPRLDRLVSASVSAAVLASCQGLAAQTDWTLLSPNNAPPAFTAHAMAYHLPTDTTVLFGGVFGGVRSSDTWLWNGSDWMQANPATVPPARVAHSMTYDAGRGRLVMFGGLGANGTTLGDTWEWDGVDWAQIAPATQSPAPRWAYCLTYHPARGTTLLFGGFANGTNSNELWEWNGIDWAQIFTATSPTPRRATDLAWDPVSNNIVLFSGYLQAADTWMFDGTNWVQQAPTTTPPARFDHSMATDLARNRIVMFGNPTVGDTWEWDGFNWLDRTNAIPPAPRVDTYLAYDWVREQVLMFGSVATAETWRYAPVTPATFTVMGLAGCPGTNSLPPRLSSFDRPWLGESFDVSIGQLPNNTIALMVSGLSDTVSGIGPLPIDLGVIGMPGCPLQVDPLIIDAVLAFGTSATWTLNIPNSAALLAQQFFSQCAALDVGANAAGLTTGNYGASRIGGK